MGTGATTAAAGSSYLLLAHDKRAVLAGTLFALGLEAVVKAFLRGAQIARLHAAVAHCCWCLGTMLLSC